MDGIAREILDVLMRWMHIGSMALLVGGAAWAWLIVRPSLEGMPDEDRKVLVARLAAGFRPMVWAALAGIAGAGIFNLFVRSGHTSYYHMTFGIKMLVVAHIFVSAVLMTRAGDSEAKFFRRAGSVVTSGLAVMLISAYLRRIF